MFRQIASDLTILDTFKNILDYNEADEFTRNKTFGIYFVRSSVRPDNTKEVSRPVELDRILYRVKKFFDEQVSSAFAFIAFMFSSQSDFMRSRILSPPFIQTPPFCSYFYQMSSPGTEITTRSETMKERRA